MENLGKRLKEIRKANDKTQKDLAEYLSVSAQSVSKWEKGLSLPTVEYLPKMAEFFHCSVNDFFIKKLINLFEHHIRTLVITSLKNIRQKTVKKQRIFF